MLIIIANIIAWPIAWYFMNEWLSTFAYHIDMDIFVCLAACFVTIFIAVITVSAQTLAAATRNPVNALRYE